jgi:VWFA-related protein
MSQFCRRRPHYKECPALPWRPALPLRRRTTILKLSLLACSSLLLLLAAAKVPAAGQDKSAQDKPAISVDVKVVNMLATVRDKKGQIVTNLGQDDFKVEEDGRPQKISYFARETDLPLTLGLLVDTSGSQRRVLPDERDASRSFLDDLLRDQDQAFLIHFDRQVELLQDLTSSHQKLESALKLLDISQPQNDSGGGNGGGGGGYPRGGGYPGGGARVRAGTLLYDAIFLASDEIMRKQNGRKAVIVLSDGVDRGSKETLEHAIETAQRTDTIVYSILFADEEAYSGFGRPGGGYGGGPYGGGPYGGGPYGRRGGGYPRFPEQRPDGKKILTQISTETGGRMFEVSKKQTVDQIYHQIEDELRSQYSLGYTPDASSAWGYHKLHVTVKQKDDVVQARQGYYQDR